jgi:hypothetical protein
MDEKEEEGSDPEEEERSDPKEEEEGSDPRNDRPTSSELPLSSSSPVRGAGTRSLGSAGLH